MKHWRVQFDNGAERSSVKNAGTLDEVIIGDLVQAENMGHGTWTVYVGPVLLYVDKRKGKVRVTVVEGLEFTENPIFDLSPEADDAKARIATAKRAKRKWGKR